MIKVLVQRNDNASVYGSNLEIQAAQMGKEPGVWPAGHDLGVTSIIGGADRRRYDPMEQSKQPWPSVHPFRREKPG